MSGTSLRLRCAMMWVMVTAAMSANALADPPPNDACPNAITIGQVTNLPFDSTDATADFFCWGCGVGWTFGPDIWYEYTAPAFGTVTIHTCSTNYYHVIAVYAGHGCPAGSLVTCNDSPATGFCPQNQVQFLANAGEQFKIRIGGLKAFCVATDEETGTGLLNVAFTPSNCGNTNAGSCCQEGGNGTPYCNNGVCCEMVCDIMPFCCDTLWDDDCAVLANTICNQCICAGQPPQELCECAGTISNNQIIPFVSPGSNTDGPAHPACGGLVLDRWWNHTVACDGILTVDTADSNFNCFIALYDGWECPVDESRLLGCNSDVAGPSVKIAVHSGQKIKVRFGSQSGDTGDADLRAVCTPFECGLAGTGSCCDTSGTGTPMCDDPDCCGAICSLDPFCCGGQWDAACAALAHIHCDSCSKAPLDDCDFDGIPDDWTTAGSVELGRFEQGDPAALQGMGWAVALQAHALLGSRGDDDGSGAVYGFDMVTNHGASMIPYKFKAADADPGDQFGYAVDLQGNLAVIGAPFDDEAGNDAGGAYVFRDFQFTNTWEQRAKVMALDAEPGDRFGEAAAISGISVLVGAILEDSGASDGGAVYAFTEQTPGEGDFVQTDKFTSTDIASFDSFGGSIDYAGFTAVIGAPGDDDNGDLSGSAYIFREVAPGDWEQIAKLIASDGETFDVFGTTVAMNELADTVVIGAPGHDGTGDNSGAAYVFRELPADSGNWVQIDKLTASDAGASHLFGQGVSITGDFDQGETIVVGAPGNEAAYLFRESLPGAGTVSFEEIDVLTAAGGTAGSEFGRAVAIAGSRAVVGAWLFPHSGASNAGAGYGYVVRSRDCNSNGIPDQCDLLSGLSRDVNGNMVPDECEDMSVPGDINMDDVVDVFDLLDLLDAWGDCEAPCPPNCPADIANSEGSEPDCSVNVFDLLLVLESWSN